MDAPGAAAGRAGGNLANCPPAGRRIIVESSHWAQPQSGFGAVNVTGGPAHFAETEPGTEARLRGSRLGLPEAGASTQRAGVPRHVAIIMDGNGRWAARRGLPRVAGHERGTDNIRRITLAAGELGIQYLTLWAFSTENWRRPADEIQGIMRILGEAIERETEELHRQGAQLRHIGSLEGLAPDLRRSVLEAIELTRHNKRLVLTLAFNYGGRQELVAAVRDLLASGITPDDVDERTIARHLYTRDVPDPDLIVRTSGEFRMSNFLLWQAAYAELFFTSVLWPDFGPEDLRQAVSDFAQRDRRFGRVSSADSILSPPGD